METGHSSATTAIRLGASFPGTGGRVVKLAPPTFVAPLPLEVAGYLWQRV